MGYLAIAVTAAVPFLTAVSAAAQGRDAGLWFLGSLQWAAGSLLAWFTLPGVVAVFTLSDTTFYAILWGLALLPLFLVTMTSGPRKPASRPRHRKVARPRWKVPDDA